MHTFLVTGRLLSRAILNGIQNFTTAADPNLQRKTEPYLVSAVCGFSKERKIQRLVKGQFGDDAWFTTKYKNAEVLDMSGNQCSYINCKRSSRTDPDIKKFKLPVGNPIICQQWVKNSGVADGVGGWRAYGIDPGEFSLHLMKTCERLVNLGRFSPTNPSELLAKSYDELLHHKKAILGSSTACVVLLNRENSTLYTANIGDSGYIVVRRGKVIRRSEEQQHYFNTPFQLSLPPPGYRQDVLSDTPDSASTDNFPVEDGDVILVATDGVFDNLPQSLILNELIKCQGERCASRLQMVANSIAWMARSLSFDETFVSPFAERAFANGINTIGGKPDDITVILATVAI